MLKGGMEEVRLPDSVDENTKICRICLKSDTKLHSIWEVGNVCDQNLKIADMLSDCTSIEFQEDDHLPSLVCLSCIIQTSKIYKFREMAFRSNMMLREKVSEAIVKEPIAESKFEVTEQDIEIDDNIVYNIKQDGEEDENDVEYVTVIVASDEATDSADDETLHCSIKNSAGELELLEEEKEDDGEEEEEEQEEYIVEDEESSVNIDAIPKMSLAKHRGRKKNNESESKSSTCHICGKTLSNYSSYRYHMQLHSDNTPFLCNECGEGFKTRNAYEGHMMTHLKSNPNKCEQCGKCYRQAASLRSHMLTHTGEKPFVCNICGKGMTQKSGYKKHMLTHTGERPHNCEICGKEFRYSSNLLMHKRTHVGDKPFGCTVCDKKFISKEQLKRHMTIHSGIKSFKCETCGKSFNRRSTLKIHQKVHEHDQHNENLSCAYCGKTYSKKSYLAAHIKSHNTSTE